MHGRLERRPWLSASSCPHMAILFLFCFVFFHFSRAKPARRFDGLNSIPRETILGFSTHQSGSDVLLAYKTMTDLQENPQYAEALAATETARDELKNSDYSDRLTISTPVCARGIHTVDLPVKRGGGFLPRLSMRGRTWLLHMGAASVCVPPTAGFQHHGRALCVH